MFRIVRITLDSLGTVDTWQLYLVTTESIPRSAQLDFAFLEFRVPGNPSACVKDGTCALAPSPGRGPRRNHE